MLLPLLAAFAVASGPTFSCQVTRVYDGDTLTCADARRVRLWGVDAPEIGGPGRGDPFARESRDALRTLVLGRRLVCKRVAANSYDRTVGRCFVYGQDVASRMALDGWVRDYPTYSDGFYARETERAQRLRRGVWRLGPDFVRRELRDLR